MKKLVIIIIIWLLHLFYKMINTLKDLIYLFKLKLSFKFKILISQNLWFLFFFKCDINYFLFWILYSKHSWKNSVYLNFLKVYFTDFSLLFCISSCFKIKFDISLEYCSILHVRLQWLKDKLCLLPKLTVIWF